MWRIVIIILSSILPGSRTTYLNYFDCDPVNQAHYCLCAKSEPAVWDIQCPARILELYPISLRVSISPFQPAEANVRVVCDPNKNHFGWRLVQGINFMNENITFRVTSLDISYCPPISTLDLNNFFQQMKMDSENLHSFSYQSWKSNTTFPSNFLNVMPNLEVVDLRNNGLEILPSFQALKNLSYLNLEGNQLKNIEQSTFQGNPNLEQIRLGGNRLSKLNMQIFPDSLVLLDLVNNDITSISNESLANLKNLQVLYLNNNPLERVESGAFSSLENLTELSLDKSKLFTLPLLKNLPKLTNLSISYSLFTSTRIITPTLATLDVVTLESETENTNFYSSTPTTSETMTIRSNEYEDAISDEDEISGKGRSEQNFMLKTNEQLIGDLYALKKLKLINDELKSLSWLGYLPNLTELVLNRNELETIPDGFFKNVPSALYVDFSKNAISELNEIDGAPLISYFDMSNNFVRYIDQRHFQKLRQLRVLLLSSNKIQYVHPKAFENLENLIILDLSNNLLSFDQGNPTFIAHKIQAEYVSEFESTTTMLPQDSFDDTDATEEITTEEIKSQNHSPLQFLVKIERINLKNNLISKIFMDWTYAHLNLKSLDLSYNKIRSLHPRDFYFVSQDVRFDLRFNEIYDVDMDYAEMLLKPLDNKNVVVLLDGNPLHCDCNAIAFKKFKMKSYHLQYSDLRCATPQILKGKKFSEISVKNLQCMLSQSCPEDCSCWELPSENLIRIECSSLDFLSSKHNSLKNLTNAYDSLEFEIDLSSIQLEPINATLMKELTPQFKFVNLTHANLTSMDFLMDLPASNNHTKFALSNNPFQCSDCKFQTVWWKNFRRIVDIKSVTCTTGKHSSSDLLKFQDIVRSSICTENAVADEVQFLLIILAILIPMIISTLICTTRLRKLIKSRSKKSTTKITTRKTDSVAGTLRIPTRAYTPTRSKVVDMDNSKF